MKGSTRIKFAVHSIKNDLLSRHLKLSELAYGTEKAKALFREMMAQASEELGFEADDIPLVIEAIPVSSDCIVLIITKVEDPDELDTRFSRFASLAGQIQGEGESHDGDADSIDEKSYVGADEILNLFKRIKEGLESSLAACCAVGDCVKASSRGGTFAAGGCACKKYRNYTVVFISIP